MRRRFLLVLTILALTTPILDAQRGPRWERLGSREVTDGADHDTIVVTAREGTFNAVQLRVQRRAVDFQRVVIHFANGDDQRLDLRATIPAGGESRVIDIDGANRVIRSVDFWYDAVTPGRGGRARVTMFGRR